MTRQSAYAWLAEATEIDREKCHIGMMNAGQAWCVVHVCEARQAA